MSIDTPNVADMRIVYDKDELLESGLASTPLEQFRLWLADAVAVGSEALIEPNAMVLSTSTPEAVVASRSVLLKAIDERGLSFFSNYGSKKAQDIEANPQVSVVFPWYPLHRQVIVIGRVSKLSREESLEYFRTRPHKSQLGACVSAQSSIIDSRDVLEDEMARLEAIYPEGTEVPMPEHWGGYLINVHSMEFWQGRRSRLHDRLRFVAKSATARIDNADDWDVIRLSP